jgi:hypothetical protein
VYDEVIYVLEGEGVLHVDDSHEPVSGGTCIHLPPLLEHSLENSGKAPLKIVAVFHPAGDPASRAYEANDDECTSNQLQPRGGEHMRRRWLFAQPGSGLALPHFLQSWLRLGGAGAWPARSAGSNYRRPRSVAQGRCVTCAVARR